MYTIGELMEIGAENRNKAMTRQQKRNQSKVFNRLMKTVKPIVIKKKGE